MNLKDYMMEPDEGLFEKIRRRLAVRRAMRIGGVALAAVAVCGAAAVLLWPKAAADEVAVAMVQPVVEETAVAAAEPEVATTVQVREAAVAVMTVKAEPEEVTTSDETVDFAQLLPQNTPAIADVKVPAEAAVATHEMSSTPRPVVQAASDDTVKPGAVAEATPKAGIPTPHYDNVIWAPNVIIPSGEVEENRTFAIKATSEITDFKLHIYNRNGRRIYMTSDPQFAWDGTMNGTNVPQGAYVWVATFRDSDGAPRQEKGTVTVIR